MSAEPLYYEAIDNLNYIFIPDEDRFMQDILLYKNLKRGWDFGEGEAIRNEIINVAIKIYQIGRGLGLNAEPHPMSDGGISIVFFIRGSNHFLDIEINSDLTFYYKHEKGIGVKFENIDEGEIENIGGIRQILTAFQCNISVYSTSENTAKLKGDFKVMFLEAITGEYQYSGEIAPKITPYTSVSI